LATVSFLPLSSHAEALGYRQVLGLKGHSFLPTPAIPECSPSSKLNEWFEFFRAFGKIVVNDH
jgi:hypothetical protein